MALNLRWGFSTGSTATAAMLGALRLFMDGIAPEKVEVPLPPLISPDCEPPFVRENARAWATLPISCAGYGQAPDMGALSLPDLPCAHAGVIKDGGDDPDATHGAMIFATFFASQSLTRDCPDFKNNCHITGGKGVGIVTRAGLGLPVNQSAINQVPQAQMRFALGNALWQNLAAHKPIPAPPYMVVISVPTGAEIAKNTMNGKLGIINGISILGTQGTVKPFSHKAWHESLRMEIDMACGKTGVICLCTGRRSEESLKKIYPQLPDYAFIQAADATRYTLEQCGYGRFSTVVWGCFFGKLLKLAQGLENGHARHGEINMDFFARLCQPVDAICASRIASAPTARAALEDILQSDKKMELIGTIMRLAQKNAEQFAHYPVRIYLFDNDGNELCRI